MAYGICRICGCSDERACYHPDFGECWWIDETHELCSHCVELKDNSIISNEKTKSMESKDYTYHDVINFTSVDDIRVKLNYYNKPRDLEFLKRSLEFEPEFKNRSAVIKLLKSKIKHIEKSIQV